MPKAVGAKTPAEEDEEEERGGEGHHAARDVVRDELGDVIERQEALRRGSARIRERGERGRRRGRSGHVPTLPRRVPRALLERLLPLGTQDETTLKHTYSFET